jgi:rSAM/selenodomain-associated transferase 1
MTQLFGAEWLFEEQVDGDLGMRLDHATRHAFTEGSLRVIVIGSDCPELTSELLQSAFQKLGFADAVIGPASDGGYYLIGLTCMAPSLFAGMPWGTSEVFTKTVANARKLELNVEILPTLRDVDRPEDVIIWKQLARITETEVGL